MIKYGLISETDGRTIEKTIDLILGCNLNDGQALYITEVGLYNCETSLGIFNYCQSKGVWPIITGIDNEKDKPINYPIWMNYIKGNSNEVYNQLEDNSQHLIFVDGNHSLPMVISDFFCYENKVKTGGYFLFHDTGRHIQPFKDYQGMGSEHDKDMYISVRAALLKIGVLQGHLDGWELIFDEADESDEAGGICAFKKLY